MKQLFSSLLLLTALAFAVEPLQLGDFAKTKWNGLQVLPQSPVGLPDGLPPETSVGCWKNLPKNPSLNAPVLPENLTPYSHLVFWLYSSEANKQGLTLLLNSENPKSAGWDYYYYHFTVDWKGWKLFNLSLKDNIGVSRAPLGWNHISSMAIHSGGWEHHPLANTTLYLAGVHFASQNYHFHLQEPATQLYSGKIQTFQAIFTNDSDKPCTATMKLLGNSKNLTVTGVPDTPFQVEANGTKSFAITLSLPANQSLKPMEAAAVTLQVLTNTPSTLPQEVTMKLVCPFPERPHPRLFCNQADIEHLKARTAKYEWARTYMESLLKEADEKLAEKVEIPAMEGQWPHHYVCKKCGISLKYDKEHRHICPKCGTVYTGWPYDQVQAAYKHGSYWTQVRLCGQAYALTGKEKYAARAREILLAYAEKYTTFPIHDVWNRHNGGARINAQTLDEAVDVIGLAWGYDLAYNAKCFSQEDHDIIKNKLFLEIANTILRNDAGISNWQTWHNAAIAAIGFTLNDAGLIQHAINGKSGLLFQFKNSILKDGFWYEGTGSYHFYALEALWMTVEAAYHAGLDYTHNPAFVSLFDAPLYYVMPDCRFPGINDGDVSSLYRLDGWYEWAYTRIGKPEYATIISKKRQSNRSFFWGADEVPRDQKVTLGSRDFNGLGALVIRRNDWYVHFDYGPHGGGHGHPDKLALNIFTGGYLQAPDPGRLAYGAPMQNAWYRQTIAHNTMTVDCRSQAATTGQLLLFQENEEFSLAQARSEHAYPGVLLHRTIGICDGVFFDIFDAVSDKEHTYDLSYHNFGSWTPELTLTPMTTPLGKDSGYQHIEKLQTVQTDKDWAVNITYKDSNGRFVMNGAPGTTLFFGEGVANNPPTPCPLVIARRKAQNTRFVSCIDFQANNGKTRNIAIQLRPDHTRENPSFDVIINGTKHYIHK